MEKYIIARAKFWPRPLLKLKNTPTSCMNSRMRMHRDVPSLLERAKAIGARYEEIEIEIQNRSLSIFQDIRHL